MHALFHNPYEKGQYDYLPYRKKQQLLAALICFFFVAAFVVAGLLIFKDRKNILMIPGVLMVLPFANFFVTYLALTGYKLLSPERRAQVKAFEDAGMGLYHLVYVDEKGKRQYLDHTVVYQNAIVAYCSKLKPERKVPVETDCILRLKKKNINMRLKIYADWESYQQRLADIEPAVPEEDVPKVEKAEELLTGMCL